MHKYWLFFCLFAGSAGSEVKAQTLEGTWVGYIEYGRTTDTYGLVFSHLRDDTVYQVLSVAYQAGPGKIDTTVSKLRGWMVKKDMMHLEESSLVKATFDESTNCYLIMELTFRHKKNKDILSGRWWAAKENCGSGYVYLIRKNEDQ